MKKVVLDEETKNRLHKDNTLEYNNKEYVVVEVNEDYVLLEEVK